MLQLCGCCYIIMATSHKRKVMSKTIINQTGNLQEERREFLQKMFNASVEHIPVKWGPNELYGEPL